MLKNNVMEKLCNIFLGEKIVESLKISVYLYVFKNDREIYYFIKE